MQQALLKMKDVRSVTSSSDNTGERQKIWQAEGKKYSTIIKKSVHETSKRQLQDTQTSLEILMGEETCGVLCTYGLLKGIFEDWISPQHPDSTDERL